MTFSSRAWLVWIAGVAILTMVVRNPLYIVILLLVTRLVEAAFGRRQQSLPFSLWRIGLIIIGASVVYNGLFVHTGATVLLTLPDLPLIGGPVTAEALAAGLINGLMLITLLSTFAALNAIVPVKELVRLAPAAMQDLGVVVLVALTYVPETRLHYERIRQAQAIRGHQLRGLRDWRPVILPLLVGGLERAMHLAETMVARGYGSTRQVAGLPAERAALVAGLAAAAVGWLLAAIGNSSGWLLLLAGTGLMGLILWRRGRHFHRTAYLPRPWRYRDSLLIFSSILCLGLVALPWPFIDQASLAYSPYPTLSLPTFDWLLGLILAALAWPAVAFYWRSRRSLSAWAADWKVR